MSKLLTVFGATGNQGGSVINSILGDAELSKEYRIRAVTRDPSKPAGEKLKSRGAEVVMGDMSDPSTLKSAVEGSYAVFGVTNFWESMSKKTEVSQGKALADAVKATGVELFVFSSLPHVTKLTNGILPNVQHFDGKAEIEEYAQSIGVPTTTVQASFFFSNLKSSFRKGEDGTYTLALPIPADCPMTLFDSQLDTGKYVAGILANPQAYVGKQILEASGWYTPTEIVEQFKAVTGKSADYVEISDGQFKNAMQLPTPELKQEMLENFILIRDFKYFGPDAKANIKESHKVVRGKLTTLPEAISNMGPW